MYYLWKTLIVHAGYLNWRISLTPINSLHRSCKVEFYYVHFWKYVGVGTNFLVYFDRKYRKKKRMEIYIIG